MVDGALTRREVRAVVAGFEEHRPTVETLPQFLDHFGVDPALVAADVAPPPAFSTASPTRVMRTAALAEFLSPTPAPRTPTPFGRGGSLDRPSEATLESRVTAAVGAGSRAQPLPLVDVLLLLADAKQRHLLRTGEGREDAAWLRGDTLHLYDACLAGSLDTRGALRAKCEELGVRFPAEFEPAPAAFTRSPFPRSPYGGSLQQDTSLRSAWTPPGEEETDELSPAAFASAFGDGADSAATTPKHAAATPGDFGLEPFTAAATTTTPRGGMDSPSSLFREDSQRTLGRTLGARVLKRDRRTSLLSGGGFVGGGGAGVAGMIRSQQRTPRPATPQPIPIPTPSPKRGTLRPASAAPSGAPHASRPTTAAPTPVRLAAAAPPSEQSSPPARSPPKRSAAPAPLLPRALQNNFRLKLSRRAATGHELLADLPPRPRSVAELMAVPIDRYTAPSADGAARPSDRPDRGPGRESVSHVSALSGIAPVTMQSLDVDAASVSDFGSSPSHATTARLRRPPSPTSTTTVVDHVARRNRHDAVERQRRCMDRVVLDHRTDPGAQLITLRRRLHVKERELRALSKPRSTPR